MRKHTLILLSLAVLTGLAAASHQNGRQPAMPTDQDGVGADRANAGPGGAPNTTTGKPNKTGPVVRMQGIGTAVTKVPSKVADNVLQPIQDLGPGQALGDMLSGLGDIFGQGTQNNQSVNNTQA